MNPTFALLISTVCLEVAFASVISAAPTLVPETPNPSPDYFCTWNLQGYVTSYGSSKAQRQSMTEANLFGSGELQGWTNIYPSLRKDLLFVMDDSWDVPPDGNAADFGSLILNNERFPSYQGPPAERLRKLVSAVKAKGWKGLGGWVCAQSAPRLAGSQTEEEYWTERMQWMRESSFAYWKVDWGKRKLDVGWRQQLTQLGQKDAPELVIEHAMTTDALKFSAVYRTYDVENIIAAPVTIERVSKLLREAPANSPTLLNCEDEPHIAAGLGCAVGIMRHPFAGNLPDGRHDIAFPSSGRNLKNRLDEVTRAVRWHRLAPPIPLGAAAAHLSPEKLQDNWVLEQGETWMPHHAGDRRDASAPARVSRGLALPEVTVPGGDIPPFVLASRSANGAVAVATIGRTLGREYLTPKADIVLSVGESEGPFGVFGLYKSFTLKFGKPLGNIRVFAQDLAADGSEDVTDRVAIKENELTFPGELLSRVGLSSATKGDWSEPGLVIVIKPAKAEN